jgi:LuxR family maltose regulon positive regulatory protein
MIATLALSHHAELHMMRGKLRAAEALYEQALALAVDDEGESLPIAGMALIGLGELARERNDLARAARLLDEGLELTRHWGELGTLDGHIALARLRQAHNDVAGSTAAMSSAVDFARHFDASDLDDRFVEAQQARLWLLRGQLSEAEQWAEGRHLHPESAAIDAESWGESPGPGYLREIECLILARLMIGQGRFRDGLALLEPLLSRMELEGRWGNTIEVQVLIALAAQGLGDGARALSALQRALRLAEPEGYVRIFADEGAPLAALLRQAAAQGVAPEYAGRLLTALRADGMAAAAKPPAMTEPLGEREVQVLRLIAAGLSNQEIAEELVLAVSTVKWHINNLYGKLGAGSRTQAVARARELNLL